MTEFCFIHKDANTPFFRELFCDNDNLIEIDDSWCWADILVHSGCFPSKGEARRNLANIKDTETLTGWHEVTVGKKRTKIYLMGKPV